MAKEDNEKCCGSKLTLMSGFIFGFGFFLANLLGLSIVGLLTWGFILLGRYLGWSI